MVLTFFKKDFIYLFLEKGRDEEREGEKQQSVVLPLTHPLSLTWPATQACDVPWLGIELVTLWFAGQHSIHWATPARAGSYIFVTLIMTTYLTVSFHRKIHHFFLYKIVYKISEVSWTPYSQPVPDPGKEHLPIILIKCLVNSTLL